MSLGPTKWLSSGGFKEVSWQTHDRLSHRPLADSPPQPLSPSWTAGGTEGSNPLITWLMLLATRPPLGGFKSYLH